MLITKEPTPRVLLEMLSCNARCDARRYPCVSKGFSCTDVCGCSASDCANSEDTGRYLEREDDRDLDTDSE